MGVKELLSEAKVFVREHYLVLILLLLSLSFFYNIKKALSEGTLPLWTPYYYSGRPLFAQPEYHFIDMNFLLIFLTGNIYFAMNFSAIFYFFLAGLGMYILAYYLSEDKKAGFVAALIYMVNGFMHSFVVPGNIMIMEGYSLLPFILFFTIKALKTKDFVFYSVLSGIFSALLVHAGGVIYLQYLFILIFVYSIVYLVDKNFVNKLIKLAIVGVIILAVFFGLSAIKLLPGIEFMGMSNRSAGISYNEYLGEPVKLSGFFFSFFSNFFFNLNGFFS